MKNLVFREKEHAVFYFVLDKKHGSGLEISVFENGETHMVYCSERNVEDFLPNGRFEYIGDVDVANYLCCACHALMTNEE